MLHHAIARLAMVVNQAFARIDQQQVYIAIVGCCLATKRLNVESDTK